MRGKEIEVSLFLVDMTVYKNSKEVIFTNSSGTNAQARNTRSFTAQRGIAFVVLPTRNWDLKVESTVCNNARTQTRLRCLFLQNVVNMLKPTKH